jgi:hypothetical protein
VPHGRRDRPRHLVLLGPMFQVQRALQDPAFREDLRGQGRRAACRWRRGARIIAKSDHAKRIQLRGLGGFSIRNAACRPARLGKKSFLGGAVQVIARTAAEN